MTKGVLATVLLLLAALPAVASGAPAHAHLERSALTATAQDTSGDSADTQTCTGALKAFIACAVKLYDEYKGTKPVQFADCALSVVEIATVPELRALKVIKNLKRAKKALKNLKTTKGLYDLRKIDKSVRPAFKLINDLAKLKLRKGWTGSKMLTRIHKVLANGGSVWKVVTLEWAWLKANIAANQGQFDTFLHDLLSLTGVDACLDLFKASGGGEGSSGEAELPLHWTGTITLHAPFNYGVIYEGSYCPGWVCEISKGAFDASWTIDTVTDGLFTKYLGDARYLLANRDDWSELEELESVPLKFDEPCPGMPGLPERLAVTKASGGGPGLEPVGIDPFRSLLYLPDHMRGDRHTTQYSCGAAVYESSDSGELSFSGIGSGGLGGPWEAPPIPLGRPLMTSPGQLVGQSTVRGVYYIPQVVSWNLAVACPDGNAPVEAVPYSSSGLLCR